MGDIYIFTAHFTSGKSLDIEFRKKKLDDLISILSKQWHGATSIGDEFGVNFSEVTHYLIRKKE